MNLIELGCKRRDEFKAGCVAEDNSKHLVQWNRNTVDPVVNSVEINGFLRMKTIIFLD